MDQNLLTKPACVSAVEAVGLLLMTLFIVAFVLLALFSPIGQLDELMPIVPSGGVGLAVYWASRRLRGLPLLER